MKANLRVLVLAAALGVTAVALGAPRSHAGAWATVTVRLGEFYFSPKVITVHVGQPVRFLNVGKIDHTVADTDAKGNIRSRLIHPRPLAHGQFQVVTFSRPGTVHYLCTFHPTLMSGRIVVVR